MPFVEAIEQSCFPPQMRHDLDSYREFISHEYSVGLLMFMEGEAIGYISGTHLCDEYLEDVLSVDSPVREAQDQTFYIDNIAIMEQHRSITALDFLIHEIVSLLKGEDYLYAVAYIRRRYGLSRLMRLRYGATLLKSVDNWEGLDEPFDCMLFSAERIPTLPRAAEYVFDLLRNYRIRILGRLKRVRGITGLPEGKHTDE